MRRFISRRLVIAAISLLVVALMHANSSARSEEPGKNLTKEEQALQGLEPEMQKIPDAPAASPGSSRDEWNSSSGNKEESNLRHVEAEAKVRREQDESKLRRDEKTSKSSVGRGEKSDLNRDDVEVKAHHAEAEYQLRREEQERSSQRAEAGTARGFLNNLTDFSSHTIVFMDTSYYTANPAEGTLASFGKMSSGKRYDRYGHIAGVEFSVEQNSWKERYLVNAAALYKLAGSRFMEYAGVGVEAAVKDKKRIEVTFVGTTVPKDEAIRRLNADAAALEYLATLEQKCAEYDKKINKLFAGPAPPEPKVVLANVVMLNGNFSKALDSSADGQLHSKILDDGVELKVTKQDGEEVTLLSPVVRCYRTYSVEFKEDPDGRPTLVEILDAKGQPHRVPQVFDLTPDI